MANAKRTTGFFCQECGYESSKWMGQCPGCKSWNTLVEEPVGKRYGGSGIPHGQMTSVPIPINEIDLRQDDKILTGIGELDRVLGGGIVPGSLTLVGGDPGIGKSTLLLQVCYQIAKAGQKVLYISGEESARQIKMRADRIGEFAKELSVLCETNLDLIRDIIEREKPIAAVIDSIQTMYRETVSSAPGSVSQVREATGLLLQLAKGSGIAIFIVGHVTKDGTVAGPRVLEHMVDTVLYFEGDRHVAHRLLRGVKNRFGATDEIGVFEMAENGLREVTNPSEYMLNGRPQDAAGSVVSSVVEGTRPILLEVQALVCRSNFGIPRRQAAGTDFNRLNLLMAVLEKRVGLQISDHDAYVNLAGGMKITEPAMDLGIVLAVVSSFKNRAIDEHTLCFGEVGLSGEVRAVSMAEGRIKEARKLGFTTCILPAANLSKMKKIEGIKLLGVNNVREAIDLIQ